MVIKKTIASTGKDVKKLGSLQAGSKMVWPLWKTVSQVTQKLNIKIPFDPIIPLLGIYTQEI